MTQEQQDELAFLQWIYATMDFGPAHEDVIEGLKDNYKSDTNKPIPKGY